MKKVAISLLFILAAGMSASVVSARGNPEQCIVKIDKHVRPCESFSPVLLCTFEANLFTKISTPAPCDNGTTALCRTAAYTGPSVVVSGRYWCSKTNDILTSAKAIASHGDPDIKQRDRYGNFKFVLRS